MSGFWDSIFSGDFSSAGNSLWEALPSASSIGDILTGASGKTSPTGAAEDKGFLESLLSPENVITGIGIYGQAKQAQSIADAKKPLSAEEQQAQDEASIANYLAKLKGELELKKEYGLLGGGGGGGGDALQRQRDIYNAKMTAMKNAIEAQGMGGQLVLEAIKNQGNLAQRGLLR